MAWLAFLLVFAAGAVAGGLRARRRRGGPLDMLQWGFAHGAAAFVAALLLVALAGLIA